VTHPAIRDLFQSLARDPAFQEAVSRLIRDPHARQSLSGLTTTAKALYIVLLWQATERNVIVVVDGNKQAEALGELVDTFFDLLVTSDLPRPQTIPAALPPRTNPVRNQFGPIEATPRCLCYNFLLTLRYENLPVLQGRDPR
jgi:hypothetical protein